MELTWSMFLIVCPLVFLAGFVDAIGGGGGLISLPAYFLAGVPVHHALATNKMSSASGTLISTIRLCRNTVIRWKLAIPAVLCALTGSYIGTRLTMLTDERILKHVLMIVLPVVAFFVFRKNSLITEKENRLEERKEMIITWIGSLFIGCYDGFYGPGTGTFLLLTFTKLGKLDMEKATGNVKVVNLTSNISALITFILAGKILWVLGLSASVFSIAGHYLGAHMVVKNGVKIIKPIILLVLALLLIKIVLGI